MLIRKYFQAKLYKIKPADLLRLNKVKLKPNQMQVDTERLFDKKPLQIVGLKGNKEKRVLIPTLQKYQPYSPIKYKPPTSTKNIKFNPVNLFISHSITISK